MEITFRDAVTVIHGIGFGALLLLAFSGAAAALYALSTSSTPWRPSGSDLILLRAYFWGMALLAWLAVLIGAYVVYPWYRAHPPAGAVDLSGFPKALLMSTPATSQWHDIGMEWKEHLAWFSPISLTAVAWLMGRYATALKDMKSVRNVLVGLLALGFFATAVPGFFGAMLNKYAPVRGGANIVLMRGEAHDK